MQMARRRVAIAGIIAGGWLTFAASPALGLTATSLSATDVTTDSALLSGSVDTGGVATAWQFEYGASSDYGSLTASTAIPGGDGTVGVQASITGLQPATTYHFQLLASTGSDGSYYYPLSTTNGGDLTFTTASLPVTKPVAGTGGVTVTVPTRAPVGVAKSGQVSLSLRCAAGDTSCSGKVKITDRVKVGKKFETLTFGSVSYTIKAGHKPTIKVKLTKSAIALLKKAPHHELKVKLTITPKHGRAITKTVTLKLKE